MHHAAAQHFDPAGVLAQPATRAAAFHAGDVHFCRRFGERKVRRPQPHGQVALEERFHEAMQYGLEVREAHALVHQQAFHLMEHRRVRGVRIHAIHATRCDDRQRQPVTCRAQRADLHRRGMRAQQHPLAIHLVIEVEGVVHGTRRMIGRHVQRREIVEVVLDFRALRDLEADFAEQPLDAQSRARDRMQAAVAFAATVERHIHPVGLQPGLDVGRIEHRTARIQRRPARPPWRR